MLSDNTILGVSPVTIPEAVDIATICFDSGAVPMIVGNPGIGKTACLEQIAEKEGIDFINFRAGSMYEALFVGIAKFDQEEKDRFHITMSKLYPRKDTKGLFVFDEFNRATRQMTQAMFSAFDSRQINDYYFPKGWKIASAANLGRKFVTTQVDSALYDRVHLIHVQADRDSWLNWANTHQIHPIITSYIEANPEELAKVGDEGADLNQLFPTPRSWERTSNLLNAAMIGGYVAIEDGVTTRNIATALAGTLGQEAAEKFGAWTQKQGIRLTASQLLNDFPAHREELVEMLSSAQGPAVTASILAGMSQYFANMATINDVQASKYSETFDGVFNILNKEGQGMFVNTFFNFDQETPQMKIIKKIVNKLSDPTREKILETLSEARDF